MRMTRPEFVEAMTTLRMAYVNAIAESQWQGMVRAYWQLLQGYSAAQLHAAFAGALTRYPDWFPSCGQLLRLLDGDPVRRAEEAWPEVLRLASRSSGKHSDPIAAEAIRLMGGGVCLGRMQADELQGYGRKRFLDAYRAASEGQQEAQTRIAGTAPRCPLSERTGETKGRPRGDNENTAKDHRGSRAETPSRMDTDARIPVHSHPEWCSTRWRQ